MSVEESVIEVLQKVLDVKPEEIQRGRSLVEALDVDSTEMVEISVGIKKALNVPVGDNELKKTHTVDEIIAILKNKGAV